MKKIFCALFLSASLAHAGEPAVDSSLGGPPAEQTPIDFFSSETTYVFESDVNHGGSVGKQDALQNSFAYGHRFLIEGNLYLHLGVSYTRFDFGKTDGPLPDQLQHAAGVISLEYMKGADIGALLEFRPGFYTQTHFGSSSFDCPITAARFFTLQPDKLYFLVGAQAAFLRGNYPVLPVIGLVWKPNAQWTVMALPPEPRVIYSPTKDLSFWAGGELAGGSFRTDNHPGYGKLSNADVDYTEYRAGAGLTYQVTRQLDLKLGGGCAIQRQFDFSRADETYRSDPAPYARFEIHARF